MSANSEVNPVVAQLQSALDGKVFPNEWHQWGARLLDHLRKPVQVAVVGLPGSGKSTLINMMLNAPVIPRLEGLPVVEIAHSLKPRVLFELENGACVRRNGTLAQMEVPPDAVRARAEIDADALLRQNFIEVGLTGTFGHQVSMVNWVVQWADVILWCTEEFGEAEQQLWANVPEELKDHSFLVLTMADRQMMRGVLQDLIDRLEPVVSEEFLCLYPVATVQAIAARSAGARINEALWRSSGGRELCAGVARQVDTGRTADMDQAQMLLNRFAGALRAAPQTSAPEIRAEALPVVAEPATPSSKLAEALRFLQDCANEMLAQFSQGEDVQSDRIVEKCLATAHRLADILHGADPEDLMAAEVLSDAQESAEMMLLFQLEHDDEAAVDAVTLLLQLKKEIAQKVSPPRAI